jgi:diadenosine tetraphosphate (Ap4A) HIT family hydrolase
MPRPLAMDPTSWDHEAGCYSCHESEIADTDLPPRQRVWRTAHWRVVHAYDTSIPGWLIVIPVRHLTSLAELEPAEAGELGPLLAGLTRALTEEVGCSKTYVLLLAEAEGFSHVHFHVVPRMADHPTELRGPKIFGALGVPPGQAVAVAETDRLATAIAARLLLAPG